MNPSGWKKSWSKIGAEHAACVVAGQPPNAASKLGFDVNGGQGVIGETVANSFNRDDS